MSRLPLVRPALSALALVLAFVLALVGLSSCRRPLGLREDAGGDAGAPSVGDSGHLDAPVGDGARFDAPVGDGARFDAPVGELPLDVARDLVGDDVAPLDGGGDAPPAICPAGVPPLDVCGCGCCGGVQIPRACYYPSRGESRDTIPNPMPTPQQCATTGCSEGEHYLCCADPGAEPAPTALYCAINASGEDLPLFAFTKRDAEVCTTIEFGSTTGLPLVSTPFGTGYARGWRGPCDGSARADAIGGLGSVTLRPARAGDTSNHYDVHVGLFFDNGSGIADASRIDVDDIAVALCTVAGCDACAGACAFDATYRYGFVGGLTAFRDTVILTPSASYQHVRSPLKTMPADVSCAPAPPACLSLSIDVADLTAAFGDADVRDAFTRSLGAGTVPFYGQDQRPSDGPAFQITRDGGGGFLIGAPCPAGSTSASCLEIPGGLSRLMSLLIAFDQQQLQSDPTCAPLLP